MADGGDTTMALLPARATKLVPRRKQRWTVEFARYFRTPRRGPATPPPPGLRHVSRGKTRHHGTWLPAASPASLAISCPSLPSAVPVLTVSIGDVVFEEHFVSILNFSWPQVTCVTDCPIRGSRVVLASFCDKSKQVQKFALRFPHVSDAESFLNSVKECSCDTMDIISSGSDYVYEDSSASEYIASNVLLQRPHDASSFEEPDQPVIETPALGYHEETEQPFFQPAIAANVDNISGFPPSFTDMLTNCSNRNDTEEPREETAMDHAPQDTEEPREETAMDHAPQEVCTMNTTHNGSVTSTADKEVDVGKETGDIMSRIKNYMGDGSFHDMLFKLEKVIDELGGDMSL